MYLYIYKCYENKRLMFQIIIYIEVLVNIQSKIIFLVHLNNIYKKLEQLYSSQKKLNLNQTQCNCSFIRIKFFYK
jgi:hypothetical protein